LICMAVLLAALVAARTLATDTKVQAPDTLTG
jgi:hypothetical protein